MKCTIKQLHDFIVKESINLNKEIINVNTRFGYKRIQACAITAYDSSQFKISTNKFSLIGSPEHHVFTQKGWIHLKDLSTADCVLTKDGYAEIKHVHLLTNKQNLYDLQVADCREYYTNGIVSHNSTIRNVIEYVIYGKVSDKKTAKDLINRINQKNLETYIKIAVDNHIVEITRKQAPAAFSVIIDGKNDISDLAGKKNVQEYLEDEILKIPFYVFNNIVSISVNDFKSFIKMTPKDKRTIIDQIFGVAIINEMCELLKKDVKISKDKLSDITTSVRVLENQISNSLRELDNLQKSIVKADAERSQELNLKIKKYKATSDKIVAKIKEFDDYVNEQQLESRKLDRKLDGIRTIDSESSRLNEKINLLKKGTCPLCGSDLQDDEHLDTLDQYQKSLAKLQAEKAVIKEEFDILKKSFDDEIADGKNQIRAYNEKLMEIRTNMRVAQTELQNLDDSNNPDKKELTGIQNLITENQNEISRIESDRKVVDNELAFYSIVDSVLSDDGIKKTAIKTILPMINQTIESVIGNLYLDFKLHFDEKFESVVTHFGQEINVGSLSTGEMKKLDFAVIVAIIKLMKFKFPGLNILFLDEIFSSLDATTSDSILILLKQLSIEMNLHIFVVNHAIFETSTFDNIFYINKNSGFTNLEIQPTN